VSASDQASMPPVRGERRRELRVSFLPIRRPRAHLATGVYPVLDASPRGFRLRHADPVRPDFGADVMGSLTFTDGRPALAFQGVVVRVQAADVVVAFPRETFPLNWLMEELAYANRGANGPLVP
jgi:hypothetical protein